MSAMKISQLIIFLTMTILMTACGQSNINGKKRISLTSKTLEQLAVQNFECASLDGGACPSGIARIFIHNPKDPDDSSVCTGFLNGNNKIVTNNHCVATLDDCSNTYISIYNGTSHENVRCKKIIQTKVDPGALSLKGVDFTVMEIDKKVTTKTFALSPSSPYAGDLLTAWVIDHKTLNDSRITELECQYQTLGKSMQLSNCPVIQGNSGSPLVNSYGEVVGLIWGSTVDEEVNASFPLESRRNLNELAMVTELRHFRSYLSAK